MVSATPAYNRLLKRKEAKSLEETLPAAKFNAFTTELWNSLAGNIGYYHNAPLTDKMFEELVAKYKTQ